MTARLHPAAAKAAVAATGATVYDTDEVPGSPQTPYVVLSVDLGLGGGYRLSGGYAATRYRILALVVGQSADEARWAAERVTAAFAGRRLGVTGFGTTPCHLETSSTLELDRDDASDERDVVRTYSATSTWTFVSTPT